MSDHVLFAVAPFVSIVALVGAATLRAMHDHSLRARPPPPARRAAFIHRLPAIGLVGVILGHILMIAWPDLVLRWNRDLFRLMAFELAFFAFGTAALIGVAAAIRRGVLRRTANGASLPEAAFLGVLFLTLVSGLGIAAVYRWAAAWSVVTLTPYARSLLTLAPNLEPIEAMPYLVRLHIFASFIVIALLAFTQGSGVVLNAVRRASRGLVNPFVSTFDRRWKPLQARALRSGRSLVWPEEED